MNKPASKAQLAKSIRAAANVCLTETQNPFAAHPNRHYDMRKMGEARRVCRRMVEAGGKVLEASA